MKYAEYYIKQNIVSINIQINILDKSLFNDLIITKNILNHIKAFVIIKKKKKIRNFNLYKIKLRLIYNDTNEHIFLKNNKKQIKSNIANIKNVEKEKVNCFEKKYLNCNNLSKTQENKLFFKDNHDLCNKTIYNNNERNNLNNESNNRNNLNIPVKIELKEREEEEDEEKKRKKDYNKKIMTNTSESILGNNIFMKKIKKINEENGLDYFDIFDVLREKNVFTKDFSLFKRKYFCKYLFLPSMLSILNVNIKSIHFILDKKLSINLLFDITVNKKSNNFFEINKNKELDNMLKIKKNIIQCKLCNSDIISYSNINFIMPHLHLNINDFFEHAFCEECTTFSYDTLKDNDNNMLIFSNCLSFNFNLIKNSELLVEKKSIENYRYMFFCNFCYNSLGYLENENENTYSYHVNKNIYDNIKFLFFNSTEEVNRNQYIKLDKSLFSSIKSYVNNVEKNGEKIKIANREYSSGFATKNTNDINEQLSDIQMNIKKKDNFLNEYVERNEKEKNKTFNCFNENIIENTFKNIKKENNYHGNLKIYIFKHKIKMLLDNVNIFNNYTDLIFLNEYILNKSEKYNTFLFYLKNDKKDKIIEIRVFIKNLYICKIMEKKKYDDFLFFQKVMKILYCLKNKNEIKYVNSELINISKEIYEDILKMLINYSYKSDIFENKFFSYLHLVQ
ncbi:conserved Plasmodium protein, unknown function [Plasmodium gallinaceum]|uniref:Uncharacterized protein n=1 Tax=Plasmodium gallinaceum TaxID=5849 RepID=A0A1J1GRJ4_PLAGA|nr:conserved Plasmodium protein, unknown function [Plasmodium gallinaceum]CRG94892.1 conserved Plasmodium protein, unknown function [Plasmodium gallinaceum]